MSSAETIAGGERRRERRSRRQAPRRPWRDPRIGKLILAIMAVVTLGYVVLSVRRVDQAGRFYGLLALGLGREDVRYLLGSPATSTDGAVAAGGQGAARWDYQLPEGGRLAATYDGSGRIAEIACEDQAMTAASCPPVLGLELGMPEDTVWYTLGAPTRQRYVGDVKLLSYDDIGVTLGLRRYTVYRIMVGGRQSGGWLGRAIRVMVP